MVNFEFENDVVGLWDASRYNESTFEKPRYTFGEFLVDGFEGSIRMYADSSITIQRLGEKEKVHDYKRQNINFSGDCVYFTQRHFIDRLLDGNDFETNGTDYLRSIAVQEAVYKSAEMKVPVEPVYE